MRGEQSIRSVREPKKSGASKFDAPLRDPGRVLLSRAAKGHSTIGAEGLNCRVRDGNGCYTLAVATGKFAVRSLLAYGRTKFPTN